MHGNLVFALVLSGLASLATAFGSLLGMMLQRPGPRMMAFALGFSAGVMMFVSFAELLSTGIHDLGFLPAVGAFFAGMVVMYVIDAVVPHRFISEQTDRAAPQGEACPDLAAGLGGLRGQHRHRYGWGREQRAALIRAGILIAIGIGMHNLPEGMATFMGAIKSRGLGLAIGSAIALHNIPEGLAVALPIFCATGSRRKAFGWAFLSGAAEFVGALLAAAVLMPLLTPTFLAVMLASVAGLMVFIAFDELIPGSYAYGFEHASVIGIIAGMGLMAVSILVLR
ncbi:MAG: zinc transporter ZupT [candidate division WOR-3 bacterium]